MYPVIARHLKTFADELREGGMCGNIPEVYVPLCNELLVFCTRVNHSVESSRPDDTETLHRDFITAAILLTSGWDKWLATNPPIPDYTRTFHEYLIRHLKGVIKAWRIWKVDRAKPRT